MKTWKKILTGIAVLTFVCTVGFGVRAADQPAADTSKTTTTTDNAGETKTAPKAHEKKKPMKQHAKKEAHKKEMHHHKKANKDEGMKQDTSKGEGQGSGY